MGTFFTPPAFVAPKPINPSLRPSRFRLTYGFELQIWNTGGTQSSVSSYVNLPINPERYDVPARYAVDIKPTIGGVSVEEAGFVSFDFTVAGTCGISGKTGWAPGTYSNGKLSGGGIFFADGTTIWRQLRLLFQVYSDILTDGGPNRPRLIWHDFENDDHWIVIPTSYNFDRDKDTTRMHYPYEIELTAVGFDAGASIPGEASIVRTVEAAVGTAVGAVNVITSFATDAGALIREANGLVTSTTNAVLGASNNLASAAAGIRDGIRDTIALPENVARAYRNSVQAWKAALGADLDVATSGGGAVTDPTTSVAIARYALASDTDDQYAVLLAQPETFGESFTDDTARDAALFAGESLISDTEIASATAAFPLNQREQQLNTARVTPGTAQRRGVVTAESNAQSSQPRGYTGARTYVVGVADTILSIAQREMGSGDLWIDIVRLNHLSAPYISAIGLPGTAATGATILIPTNDGQGIVPKPAQLTQEQTEAKVLGTDLALDANGSWQVDPANGSDWLLVSGIPNYIQALEKIRFKTDLGSNLMFPWLGILAPIGEPNGPGQPDAVALAVRRVVLSDSRTQSVSDFVVVDGGDIIDVTLTAVPRGVAQAVALSRRIG
jgi:hypothetical protein